MVGRGEQYMMHALSQAGVITPDTRKDVQNVTNACKECKMIVISAFYVRDRDREEASGLNSVFGLNYILVFLDSYRRMIDGRVINS